MRGSRVLTRCSHMPVVHFGDNEFVGADAPTGIWGGAATPPYLAGGTPAIPGFCDSFAASLRGRPSLWDLGCRALTQR